MRKFVLDVPFEQRAVASHFGARWDSSVRRFLFHGDSVPTGLRGMTSEDHSWERWVEDDLNKSFMPPRSNVMMKPRAHQTSAAKKIAGAHKAGWRGFIVADETGVGKTISCLYGAWGVARLRGFSPTRRAKVLVITTKSSIPHWRDTLSQTGLGENMRVAVINYDRLGQLLKAPASAAKAKKTKTKNRQIARGGTPLVDWDIIICDESQKLKNNSQRRAAFERIGRYSDSAKQAPFIIFASATIGQNPVELAYLSPVVSQIVKDGRTGIKSWAPMMCAQGFHITEGTRGDLSWVKDRKDDSPATLRDNNKKRERDLRALRNMLFGPQSPSVRRRPEDIKGFPSIQRITTPAIMSVGERVSYLKSWTQFRKEMRLIGGGRDPQGALAAQLRLRQKTSLLKVPHTIEQTLDLLDSGHQVLVSCSFLESIDIMRAQLEQKGIACAEVSGRVPDREAERVRFQRGQAQVVFLTVTEAISLHAEQLMADGTKASSTNRALVVHDIRYSSIEAIQIEGRGHRDGKSANVYYMFLRGTIEEKIVQVMLKRMADTKNLSGDPDSDIAAIESLYENAIIDMPTA